MASISDVIVVIDVQKPRGRIGFGTPLILGSKSGGKDYKEYSDLDMVEVDYAKGTDEYKAAEAIFAQGDYAPAKIAITCHNSTAAATETLSDRLKSVYDRDWYFLIYTKDTVASIIELADEIEKAKGKIFVARSSSKEEAQTIKDKKYDNTAVFYHTTTNNYPDAALVGRAGSAPVGSVTWKFKTLAGIQPLDIDATELRAIHDTGAITYVIKSGDNVTSEGKTVSGEYIDVIHSNDFVKFTIEYEVQKLLNNSGKIPYTTQGISLIEGIVKSVLQRANNQGIIANDADGIGLYGTDFKPREAVDPEDRAKRVYREGNFWYELAGAIHGARINGVVRY
ncbi:DUF3383 family protein [Paenibacillus albiflavus]|uniref:DUF3383 family protein n=1 Tax=Paenibacillus albiflavus TaxID=2545760 RepID=A0A4R4EAA4_9BACL|nr:DUF3383 family protein [Paenibacillus albiflavus]TCZ76177.1 DUF3383 family protein [Paenibacillus albiflavus]